MLNRRSPRGERWSDGRAAPLNLVLVVVFALLAVVLLTKTAFDARGIGADIDRRITPQLSAVDGDLDTLPALDRTGALAEDIATTILPIAESLGRAADAMAASARDAEGVGADAAAIRENVAGIDASVAAIRASLVELGPIVVGILDGTGDIARNLAGARVATDRAAATLARVLATLRGVVVDAAAMRAVVARIEASQARIERHGASAAAAKVLDCPADSRSCVP
ncbi:MAG: hypothetical protein ACT4QF_11205 [Sporichthyaceae bacterium]